MLTNADRAALQKAGEKERARIIKAKDQMSVRLERMTKKIRKLHPEASEREVLHEVAETKAYMDYEKISARLGRLVTALEHLEREE